MLNTGLIIALCIAVVLAFIGGCLAGLFAGLYLQAKQTAIVWEKTYTHVRELLNLQTDTYNTGRQPGQRRDPAAFEHRPPQAPPPPPAAREEPPYGSLTGRNRWDALTTGDEGDFPPGEDPAGPQMRR